MILALLTALFFITLVLTFMYGYYRGIVRGIKVYDEKVREIFDWHDKKDGQ